VKIEITFRIFRAVVVEVMVYGLLCVICHVVMSD
jgi:hypothetical protein